MRNEDGSYKRNRLQDWVDNRAEYDFNKAAKKFCERNYSHYYAKPATEAELLSVPAEYRQSMRDAQFLIDRVDFTALGPAGRGGLLFRDSETDRQIAIQNRPPPGEEVVCMVDSVGLVLESAPYFFEQRAERVRKAQQDKSVPPARKKKTKRGARAGVKRGTGKSSRAKRAREWEAAQRQDS